MVMIVKRNNERMQCNIATGKSDDDDIVWLSKCPDGIDALGIKTSMCTREDC